MQEDVQPPALLYMNGTITPKHSLSCWDNYILIAHNNPKGDYSMLGQSY